MEVVFVTEERDWDQHTSGSPCILLGLSTGWEGGEAAELCDGFWIQLLNQTSVLFGTNRAGFCLVVKGCQIPDLRHCLSNEK